MDAYADGLYVMSFALRDLLTNNTITKISNSNPPAAHADAMIIVCVGMDTASKVLAAAACVVTEMIVDPFTTSVLVTITSDANGVVAGGADVTGAAEVGAGADDTATGAVVLLVGVSLSNRVNVCATGSSAKSANKLSFIVNRKQSGSEAILMATQNVAHTAVSRTLQLDLFLADRFKRKMKAGISHECDLNGCIPS